MPDVVGIRFKQCGRIYDFEVNGTGEEYKKGDIVIVESELGLSIGNVVSERHILENPAKELRKVMRKANDEDLKQKQENEAFEKEAKDFCLERIMARGLPMKLVSTESTLDKKRIIFYFTADGRIDFREIVKDLAARFKTRIEMRQIGVRDEARIVGGFGICGRELCCKTFLTSFEPISIKMAKQQDLVLNMSKLSGVCGRLMCCLSYELSDEGAAVTARAPSSDNVAPQKTLEEEANAEAESGYGTEPSIKQEVCELSSQSLQPVPAPEVVSDKGSAPVQPEQRQNHERRKRRKRRWRQFHKK